MPEIFISYIHEDEIAANALLKFLQSKLPEGIEIFVAGDQLRLGDDWLTKIRIALKAAKIIIALFSPEAIERPWVNFEAGGAWFSEDKTLIPVCIGGLSPARLPKPYSNIQGADLQDRELIWYVVQDLWKLLAPTAISPPPFSRNDSGVKDRYEGLDWWSRARRARTAYERRTEEKPP